MHCNVFRALGLTAMVALLSACETTSTAQINPYQQTFDQSGVRSILVLPVTNGSVNIHAPGTMLSVLPRLLGERGYYVFPVNTVKVVLENEGLYDAAEVQQLPPESLALMFGASAILYINVEYWDTQYVVLNSTTSVTLAFRMLNSGGEEIWRDRETVSVSSQNDSNSGSLLGDLIGEALSAALTRAFPDYRPLAIKASEAAFLQGGSRIPAGPYHPSKTAAPPLP
ncbi:GNA1162 family protein [Teredinibacter purpureus]|jgi:Uncharacterized protein conserved in bacteria|uniref:GNA1162 family protein n=1 Tax=Teredinibacter purpureus TaxID=2731756 RepID=UPI0005F79CDD|nr:GNA1162 family protein [Teredinibacter purpureus]